MTEMEQMVADAKPTISLFIKNWRFYFLMLPNQVKFKILELVDDIDTRLAFRLSPRRLVLPRNLVRYEAIYDQTNKKMYDFMGLAEDPPYWVLRENIEFDYFRSPNIHVFNMGWQPYGMTLYSIDGPTESTPCFNHIVKHSVKFI